MFETFMCGFLEVPQSALQGDPRNVLLPNMPSLYLPSALKADTDNGAWIPWHRYRACGTHRGSIPRWKNQSRLQSDRHQTEGTPAPVTDDAAWMLLKNRSGYDTLFSLLSGCTVEAEESVGLFDQLRTPTGEEDTASEVVKLVGTVSVLLDQLDAVIQPFTDGVGLVVFDQKSAACCGEDVKDTSRVTISNQTMILILFPSLFILLPDAGVSAELVNADSLRKMGRSVKLDGSHDMPDNGFGHAVVESDIRDRHDCLEIFTDGKIECHGDACVRIEPVDRLREGNMTAFAEIVTPVEREESVLLRNRHVANTLYAAALLHAVIAAALRTDAQRDVRKYDTVLITGTVMNHVLDFKFRRVLGYGG